MNEVEIQMDTPVGRATLAASAAGLTRVSVGGAPNPASPDVRVATAAREHAEQARRELGEYFAGKRTTFDVVLAPEGTELERAVWTQIARIPFGATLTYGEIARALGRPTATRPVGRATGQNPLWVIVPCHRVVGAGGALTGYAGGLPTKRWLLEHEGARVGGTGARARVVCAAARLVS